MQDQKHLFNLSEEITYLNTAYMSAQLQTVEQAGIEAIKIKSNPFQLTDIDFFKNRAVLKGLFSDLINANDPENIAIIPSVSYGLANAANNIDFKKGEEIIVLHEQFPSNIYCWQEIAYKNEAIIKTINIPENLENRAKLWNEKLINSISDSTKVVAIPQVHWSDGTIFDLKAIRKKTREHNALLIIDGSQSVGAFPFSIKEIDPDALICCGYKWLLGPYSLGLAYYGDYFHKGTPIENNWMNKKGSEDFSRLSEYTDEFQPKAGRYSVGESSNFVLVPMLIKALEQLSKWPASEIQSYCNSISLEAINSLRALGCFIEDDNYRSKHMFGIYLPDPLLIPKLKAQFKAEGIFASIRGNAVRVSCHLYNTKADFDKLVTCIKKVLA